MALQHRLTRLLLRPFRRGLEEAVATIEAWQGDGGLSPHWPPLFIVGLPRVGSTLVYQAIVRRFVVAYLCNAAAWHPRAPAVVTALLTRSVGIWPPNTFTSNYGTTTGWNAPAQGREMWGRWFPPDQAYQGEGALSATAIREMRAVVTKLEAAFSAPFVNKAQGHAVRIPGLCEAFPHALFIRMRREHDAIRLSILKGRRECFHDESHWFSAKPSNYESLRGLDPIAQIIGQIRGIEADMDRDLAAVGTERVFTIDYERFCVEPHAVLEKVAAFYALQTGRTLAARADVPRSFTISRPLPPQVILNGSFGSD